MAYGKWIGGFLGFINTHSVLGAIAGFVLGSIFDIFSDRKQQSSYSDSSYDDILNSPQQGERHGFLFSLMVLSAHIIQADGKIMHSEMELVRTFLRNSFGENAVSQGNDILLKLFEYRKLKGETVWNQQIRSSCQEMARSMPEEYRIQLIAFLAQIAKVDGRVDSVEVDALKDIAVNLNLNPGVVDSMFALGGSSLEDAYKVLGISSSATDEEVRSAYRRMVMLNHPDKVANLGEDIREAATKKLQEINHAKDIIYKARNL